MANIKPNGKNPTRKDSIKYLQGHKDITEKDIENQRIILGMNKSQKRRLSIKLRDELISTYGIGDARLRHVDSIDLWQLYALKRDLAQQTKDNTKNKEYNTDVNNMVSSVANTTADAKPSSFKAVTPAILKDKSVEVINSHGVDIITFQKPQKVNEIPRTVQENIKPIVELPHMHLLTVRKKGALLYLAFQKGKVSAINTANLKDFENKKSNNKIVHDYDLQLSFQCARKSKKNFNTYLHEQFSPGKLNQSQELTDIAMMVLENKAYVRSQDKYCRYCLVKPAETVDHVWPKQLGGCSHLHNLVGCCSECNNKKANFHPKEVGMKLHLPVRFFYPQDNIWAKDLRVKDTNEDK